MDKEDEKMKNKRIIPFCSIFIAFLNLFDGMATHYGINHNFIEELNPLMNFAMEISPFLFLCTKILLSILILCLSYWVYQKSKTTFVTFYLYSLVGVSVMYTAICGMHLAWLSML